MKRQKVKKKLIKRSFGHSDKRGRKLFIFLLILFAAISLIMGYHRFLRFINQGNCIQEPAPKEIQDTGN